MYKKAPPKIIPETGRIFNDSITYEKATSTTTTTPARPELRSCKEHYNLNSGPFTQ